MKKTPWESTKSSQGQLDAIL